MRFWRILFLAVLTVAIMGFAFWSAFRFSGEARKGVGMKRLSGTVAEGFLYRSGKEFHPRASCGACRISKVKLGVFSIGGMDVLEFDDLVVNVPPSPGTEDRIPGKASGAAVADMQRDSIGGDVAQCLDLKPLVEMALGGRMKTFVGIRIDRFALNLMDGEKLKPVFSAARVKNRKKAIVMQEVKIFRNGKEERLASARLELKPRIKITWNGGFWDITDIVSGLR